MEVVSTIRELRERMKSFRKTRSGDSMIGFVPTMGYLHEGHASLIRAARRDCDIVILSIFVNPLQFGPNEDFERYPRDPQRDKQIAEHAGADLIFMPDTAEMYPQPIRSKVVVSDLTSRLCGASRPGHFDGVATVVMKLLQIVQPDRAYFGMKDAQQVAVIRQMVSDLNVPLEIVPCPIVREPDGLAMSSRNVYLNPQERRQALVLSQALELAETWLKEKPIAVEQLKERIVRHIETASLAEIDYAEILTFPSLQPVEKLDAADNATEQIIVALAVKFGRTRLIDNRIFVLNHGGERLCFER